jgi:sterol desaturase/sphingolipid hydroxylase (fatty acid hydroxylase superfamily)
MYDFLVRHADATQILLFAIVVSTLWAVEHIVLAVPDGQKLRHTGINVLFVLTALPAELALSTLCLAVSRLVTSHGWGLVALMPDPSSPWVRYILVFVALDLLDYVYHRTMHHIPSLWRFHLVHHTDPMVDSSTTVREHPGESVVRGGFLVLWTFLLGASFEVLLLRQAAETVSAIFAHSALRLPERMARVLGFVFITPNLHHVHHHFELPYTNCNYGGVFSVWDRLFGTFAELPADKTVFGLDTHMEPVAITHFVPLMTMPFQNDGEPVTGDFGLQATLGVDPA